MLCVRVQDIETGTATLKVLTPSDSMMNCDGYVIESSEAESFRLWLSSGFDGEMFDYGFSSVLVLFAVGFGAGIIANLLRKMR